MRRAVCPGSFDPVTWGHLDVIGRAAQLFDEVVVAVGINPAKQHLFSPEERIEMLREACAAHPQVTVTSFSGLLTAFCQAQSASTIVKGVRGTDDVGYELQMAQMNHAQSGVETVFLPASAAHGFVASSLVREIAGLGGDVSAFVPAPVLARLSARLAERGAQHAAPGDLPG